MNSNGEIPINFDVLLRLHTAGVFGVLIILGETTSNTSSETKCPTKGSRRSDCMDIGEELREGVVGAVLMGVFGGVITVVTSDTIGFGFLRGFFTLLFECMINTFERTGEFSFMV